MQTNLADFIKDTPEGREADAILRKCVHCGFCTATCPTYQLLGDELDGPRGRIYLIKQVLEGAQPTAKTQLHLDRCLTCRACETTCPSGVHYSRLLDIGRHVVDQQRRPRGPVEALERSALRAVDPASARCSGRCSGSGNSCARCCRPRSSARCPRASRPPGRGPRASTPARCWSSKAACSRRSRRTPTRPPRACSTGSASRSCARHGAGCCGGVSFHTGAEDEALDYMRRNVDAWWPHVEAGAEAIVITASGCGTMVKDYGLPARPRPRLRRQGPPHLRTHEGHQRSDRGRAATS